MKNKISKLLIIVGLVFILGSLALKIYSKKIEDKGINNFENKISQTTTVDKVKLGDEIALIEIPSVNLESVVVSGMKDDYLKYYVCHFENSANPGDYGNFALAGHSSYLYNQVFNKVHKVNIGDEINIKTPTETFSYTITQIFETHPSNIDVLNQNMDKKEMTIVTCTNTGEDRLIVKAEIVE